MASRRGRARSSACVCDLELEECLLAHDSRRALLIRDARQLHDDTVIALLEDDRLGDAVAFDARADGLERAIDRVGLVLLGNRLLGVIDLEHQMHAALKVEPLLQWNLALHTLMEHPVDSPASDRHVARKQKAHRRHEHRDDEQEPVLQL
jgi:hypothetical protein